jgi:hypothetical protein
MTILERCIFCNKIIWPWQNRYLGSTPAHAVCDYSKLKEDIEMFVREGWMDNLTAHHNLLQAELHRYTKIL